MEYEKDELVSSKKPWLSSYPKGANKTKLPKMKAIEYIYYQNSGYPNDIALEYFGRQITYKEFFENVEKAAKAFKTIGVKEGDYVPICGFPVPEAVYSLYALNRIGAVANMINPLLPKDLVKHQLEHPKYDYVVLFDSLYDHLKEPIRTSGTKNTILYSSSDSLPVPLKKAAQFKSRFKLKEMRRYSDNLILWQDFIKQGLNYSGPLDTPYEENSAFAVVYSSGSTGIPKGIVLGNDGLNATIHQHKVSGMRFERQKKYLNFLPLFLSTAITSALHLPLCLGVTTILEPRFDKKLFADQLIQYKPQYLIVNPNFWFEAIDCGKLDNEDLSFLIYPIIGGENCSIRNEERINKYFAKHGFKNGIGKGAGQSELGAVICVTKENSNPLFSQGQILTHINAAIVDPITGEELGCNQRGELYVDSPSRMLGFYNDEEKTKKYFEDGYGKTGDIAEIDEMGNVYYYGRKYDSVVINDETIYLFDIATTIYTEYRVNICKVVEIKHNDQSYIIANISLYNEFSGLNEQVMFSLNKILQKEYPQIKVYFKFFDELPINRSGKIDSVLLKEQKEFKYIDNYEIKDLKITE